LDDRTPPDTRACTWTFGCRPGTPAAASKGSDCSKTAFSWEGVSFDYMLEIPATACLRQYMTLSMSLSRQRARPFSTGFLQAPLRCSFSPWSFPFSTATLPPLHWNIFLPHVFVGQGDFLSLVIQKRRIGSYSNTFPDSPPLRKDFSAGVPVSAQLHPSLAWSSILNI